MQIEDLKARLYFVGQVLKPVVVQNGNNKDKICETVAALYDLISEYERDMLKFIEHKRHIKELITAINDDVCRLILEERYMNLKRWEDIASDNNYSWKHVHKIHRRGLELIEYKEE